MGNIVNLFEELRARLANGITTGEPLEGVKRIKIGTSEEARKINDYPIININLNNGELTPIETTRKSTNLLTFEISLIVNKKDSQSNLLYDTSDQTGGIYLLEKMLNVIDKDTSGNVDLLFNSTAHEYRQISYDFDGTNESILQINVTLTVETLQFSLGSM